jgi:hypothetical protein
MKKEKSRDGNLVLVKEEIEESWIEARRLEGWIVKVVR